MIIKGKGERRKGKRKRRMNAISPHFPSVDHDRTQ